MHRVEQRTPSAAAVGGSSHPTTYHGVMFAHQAPQNDRSSPWVEIVEQPKERGLRFRYKCEGRSAGSILGANSTNEHKSFPKIKIHNFDCSVAIVVVSCVTSEAPHAPHPHCLVGTDCKDGVCTVKVKGVNTVTFTNIGIQCCKRQEVAASLKVRDTMRVNPFATPAMTDTGKIDLSTVRLCFQVFLPDANGKFTKIVQPVVSNVIVDKKSVRDLVICRLSRQSGYVQGGDEVFLLCEKINKDDIQVRFYEETEDGIAWEAFGEFSPQDVHHQYAIVFQTPPYKDTGITSPAQVYIQLRRPSDDDVSDPKPFQYIPIDPDPYHIQSKRKRLAGEAVGENSMNQMTSVIPLAVKDDYYDDSYPTSSLKQNLKNKVERRICKKEKTPSATATSESVLSEYSFDNTGSDVTYSVMTSTGYVQMQAADGSKYFALQPSMHGVEHTGTGNVGSSMPILVDLSSGQLMHNGTVLQLATGNDSFVVGGMTSETGAVGGAASADVKFCGDVMASGSAADEYTR